MYRMCFTKYKNTWDVLPRLLKHNYSDGPLQSCMWLSLDLLIWFFVFVTGEPIFHLLLFLSYFGDAISESIFLLHRLVTSWWTTSVLWSPEDRAFISGTPYGSAPPFPQRHSYTALEISDSQKVPEKLGLALPRCYHHLPCIAAASRCSCTPGRGVSTLIKPTSVFHRRTNATPPLKHADLPCVSVSPGREVRTFFLGAIPFQEAHL